LFPPFPKVIQLWTPASRDLPQITAFVATPAFQYRRLLELKIEFAANPKVQNCQSGAAARKKIRRPGGGGFTRPANIRDAALSVGACDSR
jgi:hypothetical protein